MTKRSRRFSVDMRENHALILLPDEILAEIISRLPLIEAARTSVLSTRWKYLWNFSTALNFYAPRKLWKVQNSSELKQARKEYVSWVNKILDLHQGKNLNEFRIKFHLLNLHEETITRWVYTAIAKGVQNLELDLNYMIGAWEGLEYQYGLPANFVRSLRQFSGFRCFKSLRFVNVGISRETVEFFIYNCPVLEELRVSHVDSQHFLGLKVVGSSIRLKYLELYCCFSIEELDISAPSLLSLKFYGSNIRRLKIENVPLLVDVSIGGTVYIQLKNLVEPIADYLTQLETLELSFNLDHDNLRFPLPALPKLKHLIFDALAPDNKNLRQLTLVMKACPFLQKFTLKLVHAAPSRRRIIRKFPKWSYEHLKEVTFVGFEAVPIELELAYYLLENAVALERMIVNPTYTSSLGSYEEFEDNERKIATRERAKMLLGEQVPQGVEFVIL